MRALAATLSGLILLAACQGEPTPPTGPMTVQAREAWCRPTPNGARTAACYVTLTASANDRLVGAASPAAGEVQVHEMELSDGVMRMRELEDGLALADGEPVILRPGAAHLMLMGLTAPLTEGSVTTLTLSFQNAEAITVEAAIRQPAA